MATEKEIELEKKIAEQEKKLKTMFQAMQRMERFIKMVEVKANRGVDISRKNAGEVLTLKRILKQRD